MDDVAARLDEVYSENEGRVYPRHVLAECGDALVLFAAAFNGRQDAYWIAEAGLRATCIDIRSLSHMRNLYPLSWEFVQVDAFDYADKAKRDGRTWDVVSIDCPSGAFERCAQMVDTWCALANVAVILGSNGRDVTPPDGWLVTTVTQRSTFAGGVYWTLIEREAE